MRMPITERLTFSQWRDRNFWKLFCVYLSSRLNLENWDDFCALCFVCEQNKEMHLS